MRTRKPAGAAPDGERTDPSSLHSRAGGIRHIRRQLAYAVSSGYVAPAISGAEVQRYLRHDGRQTPGDVRRPHLATGQQKVCSNAQPGLPEITRIDGRSRIKAEGAGWNVGAGYVINRSSVSQVSVGSEFHTEYQGITSTDLTYWTLTFETTDFQQFTRYLYLGGNEREMNQNRPILGKNIQKLGEFFQLVQGDSFTSTGGYKTTFGYGWWIN